MIHQSGMELPLKDQDAMDTMVRPLKLRARRKLKRPGRPQKSANAEDMRTRILDAAEALFAHHGLDAVSVRDVARASHVDTALVHYYFETKRGLFDAVFGRRAEILNRERIATIDAYEAAPGSGGVTVEGLIDAFLKPLFTTAASGGQKWKDYYALIAQVNNNPDWGGETMTRFFDPVIRHLIAALRRKMPAARDEDLFWSYHFLSGALTLTFAQTGRIDRLSDGLCKSSDFDAASARMARYIAAGFRAVCKAHGQKAKRRR
jgi:AcrR family transcriptional regulator